MIYTDGVKFFAEEGGEHGAYWFLDLVATEVLPMQSRHPFLFLVLTVADEKAELRVEDGNRKRLNQRPIAYTDLQSGEWTFYLIENTLLLVTEY